jgi:secondary thiamine-phosphate synthase enzyme
MFTQFEVETSKRTELVDITHRVKEAAHQWKLHAGVCVVFVPHTTAAITINESADASVKQDMRKKLDDLVPWNDDYSHMEGNSAAHIKASIMGSSEQLIIKEEKLLLGTWQGIFLTEFDGPRTRKVCVKLIEE